MRPLYSQQSFGERRSCGGHIAITTAGGAVIFHMVEVTASRGIGAGSGRSGREPLSELGYRLVRRIEQAGDLTPLQVCPRFPGGSVWDQ